MDLCIEVLMEDSIPLVRLEHGARSVVHLFGLVGLVAQSLMTAEKIKKLPI